MQPDDMPSDIEVLWEKFLTHTLSDSESTQLLAWFEQHPAAVRQKQNEARLSGALHYLFSSHENSDRLIESVQSRVAGRTIGHPSTRFLAKTMARVEKKAESQRRRKLERRGFFQLYRTPLRLSAAAVFVLGSFLLLAYLSDKSEKPAGTIVTHNPESAASHVPGNGNPESNSADIVVDSGQVLSLAAESVLGKRIVVREGASALLYYEDGTVIDLRQNTRIEFRPTDQLTGKALFLQEGRLAGNIAPQPKDRPFQIHSPHGTATVMGTEFWLTTGKQSTSVDLLEGQVQLRRAGDNAELLLSAGQRAVLDSAAPLTAVSSRVAASATATLNSIDRIIGVARKKSKDVGYYTDVDANVGVLGHSDSKQSVTAILGFKLPTLPQGSVVVGATLSFRFKKYSSDAVPHVYVIDTLNPEASGTVFFYHGPAKSTDSAKFAGLGAAGEDKKEAKPFFRAVKFRLSDDALDLLKAYYGQDNVPDREEAFFRFNLSLNPKTLDDEKSFSVDVDGSKPFLQILYSNQ